MYMSEVTLSETTTERLKKWSEQLKRPYEELEKLFKDQFAVAEMQLKDQNLSKETIEIHVRKQMGNDLRPGRSRAATYEGVALGYGPLKDWNARYFRDAAVEFAKDPMSCAGMGLTTDTGAPLVTAEIKEDKGQYFKQNIGDILAHDYERHLLAVGRALIQEDNDDTLRIFHIRLNGDPAVFGPKFPAPPTGLVCRWRCNVQEVDKENNWVRANGATVTIFEPTEINAKSGIVKGILEPIKCISLLGQVTKQFRAGFVADEKNDIPTIEEWTIKHGKKKGFYCVAQAELLQMFQASFLFGDADQLELESIPSIMMSLDPAIPDQMFYGENSTVVAAFEPYFRDKRVRGDDNRWVSVLDTKGKPVQELVANNLAVFPVIAMPKPEPKPVDTPPDEPKQAEAEDEPESTEITL